MSRNEKNLNNYKIEHLERREMFSADAPIDVPIRCIKDSE